ncbi:MAG: HNH endonuclease signature motif containing protein [Byssovorax sp.]
MVRARAGHRCEYCHAPEQWQYVEFTMEHLVPIAAGGASTVENLALACFACNRHKWDRRTGTDPEVGVESRLFDPRADRWNDHFAWSADGLELVGVTPVGRATVNMLALNRDRLKQIRAGDLEVGRHPPETDSRLH